MKIVPNLEFRGKCYKCNRPLSSCMCQYINAIDTKTQFIILMHPKEHQKTKNGTGYFTQLSLNNSQLFIGVDFSNHTPINDIINNKNNQCYILYPGQDSINLSHQKISKESKNLVVFIIDSTWACSRKMLRLSKNLQKIQKISFDSKKLSEFKIKAQPKEYCLSTIESTLTLLELLNKQNKEIITPYELERFLQPFQKMVEFQLECREYKKVRIK